MAWTWDRIVALNKLVCEASGQPHAVRQAPSQPEIEITGKWIAENHPFMEGNKRTAICIEVCKALEGV